ncbi:MAG: hypothetical protein N2663_07815, partial [Chlorobi bacterium]|nr:hypothetical protein [Chlorobiota bacterium]
MNGSFRRAAYFIAATLGILLLGSASATAQTSPSSTSTSRPERNQLSVPAQGLEFLENKGQVRDDKGQPAEQVRFTAHSNGTKLFFMPDRIAHVFYTIEGPGARYEPGKGVSSKELDQTTLRYQRVDMELVGASRNVNLRAQDL